MANESGSSTAETVPEPPQALRQKHRDGNNAFTFFPEHLDYVFVDRKGTKVHRRIPWISVPSRFSVRDRTRTNVQLGRGIRLSALLLLLITGSQLGHAHASVTFIAFAGVLLVSTLWLSRHFRLGHSLVGTKQGNIIIFHGAEHDAILDRIMHARETFLRRFATVDPERSIRWNLQRQRWLVDQDAISLDEFAGFQQKLLPGLSESLLQKPVETPRELRIEQHFFNSAFFFDFKPDYVAYRRRTALGNETAVNFKYADLAEPNLDVQTAAPSQLAPQVTLWSGIIALGTVAEMYGRLPRSALIGSDAWQHILLAIGPGLAGFAIVGTVVRRWLRVVCTKLPSGMTILKDKRHDGVIAELRERRRIALRALAAPDPLLSRAEQANRFAILQHLGILDADAIPDLLARSEALQAHLGLSDPDPTANAPAPGEDLGEPDAPKTLH